MAAQMTIGKKLMMGYGALIALLAGFGAYSLNTIGRMSDIQTELAHRQTTKLLAAAELTNLAETLGSAERDLLIGALTNNATEAQKSADEVEKARASFEKVLADLRPALQTGHAQRMAASLDSAFRIWWPVHEEIARLCAEGKGQAAGQLRIQKSEPLLDGMDEETDQLAKEVKEVQEGIAAAGEQMAARSHWYALLMIVLSFGVSMIGLVVVQRAIRELRDIASALDQGASQVASAASQVSSSSQSLAQGSSEQAASLEETSASSEEIHCTARKNTENSRSAADLVTESQRKFIQTNQSLEQTVVAMAEINAQSGKISKIIQVIDEIAFQTNILALNAAVEAARAGEAGMGFAVVANEVRNLAQRCAQAAQDTAALIEGSIAKSNDGKTKVDEVALAIRAITEESGTVKTLVDQVNLGSQEQARGIEQIGKAIMLMERVTQSTAANAEESAAAAEELTAQSQALKDIVARLTLVVDGARRV